MMLTSLILLQAIQPLPAVQAVAAATTVKPKMVCRTVGSTGTRLGSKRICALKADWEQREFQDKQAIERMSANTNEHVGSD